MRNLLLGLFLSAGLAASASAQVYTMTFDDVPLYSSPADYYKGGMSSAGITPPVGPGPDYGVTWSNAQQVWGTANTIATNVPSGSQFLAFGGDGFVDSAVMNVAGGFSTGVSFFYMYAVSVEVWSGENGTGTLLAQLIPTYPVDPPSCGYYCVWYSDGISFDGVAHSVTFDGYYDVSLIDSVSIGTTVPLAVPVPEPATVWLMLGGVIALGGAAWAKRRESRA